MVCGGHARVDVVDGCSGGIRRFSNPVNAVSLRGAATTYAPDFTGSAH